MDVDVDRGSFGPVLRRLRLEANMSQEELAERAHLSVEGVSALERGRRRAPYRETVRLLAEALRLSELGRAELIAAAQRSKQLVRRTTTYDSAEGASAPSDRSFSVLGPLHNVPIETTELIGRADVLARIRSLLTTTRLLTVTGPGGIGKTRVALEAARTIASGQGSETWFIDLAPIQDSGLVALTIKTAIGLKSTSNRSSLENIIFYIGEKSMLLVLDNCEHVIDEVADIVRVVLESCRNVRLLATSREAIRLSGEVAFRLPSLSVPPANDLLEPHALLSYSSVKLFLERVKAASADLTLTDPNLLDVGAICRRLDGIPLAIELAAAQSHALSITELRRRLEETFDILTGRQRGSLPRQQTMRALIDWSYDLLSERERVLFRRLSVFSGGWTFEAMQAVCSDEAFGEDELLETLSALVLKSLVVSETGGERSRYHFLESTRLYAREKLVGAERERFEERHAAWVADFADWADATAWTWFKEDWQEVVSAEIDNIRSALKSMLGPGKDAVTAARIAASLSDLWYEGGLQAEGRRWLEAALHRVNEETDPILAGRLWRALALLSTGKRIVEACQRALALLKSDSTSKHLANAHSQLGFGLWQVGQLDEALEATNYALQLVVDCGLNHTRRFADTLDLRASILVAQGNFEAARNVFSETYELFRVLLDDHGMARTQGNLAELEFASGNVRGAIVLVARAITTFRRLGAPSRLATALINAAAYRLTLAEVDQACTDALEALDIARTAQDTPLISIAVQQLAIVLALRGNPKPAALLIGYVDRWYESEGYQRELNEQKMYEILLTELDKHLSRDETEGLMRKGATFGEEQIYESAKRFIGHTV